MLSMRWTQCPLPNISEAFRGNFGHRNKLMLRSDCNILQAVSTETGIFLSYLYIAVSLLQCNTPYRNLTNFHTWQLRVNTSTQQLMQRCSTYNRANFASRRECLSNSHSLARVARALTGVNYHRNVSVSILVNQIASANHAWSNRPLKGGQFIKNFVRWAR